MTVVRTALHSVLTFVRLVWRGVLRQPTDRRGAEIEGFRVFRETRRADVRGDVVLRVWFRLRGVHRHNRLRAAVFRRVCLCTTPFFSGVDGFVLKLWMEDRADARYLGIYEFESVGTAARYADYIERILRVFSVPGSIAHAIVAGAGVDTLAAVRPPATATPSVVAAAQAG